VPATSGIDSPFSERLAFSIVMANEMA
jgi:hypothetical protein